MPKWLIVVGVVLLLIVLVCCGGVTTCIVVGRRAARAVAEKTSGITMNKDGSGFSVKTENGEMSLGGGSLPASFPTDVPVYAGLTPTMSFGDAKTGSGTVIFGGKAGATEVSGWYEEQMKAKGWTETASENLGEGSAMSFTKGERQSSVLVSGGNGNVSVTVTYGKKGAGGATGGEGGAGAGAGEAPRLEGMMGGAGAPVQEKAGGDAGAAAGNGGEAASAERVAELKAMKLPKNFPTDVPLYKGMTATFSASDNMKGSGVVHVQGKVSVAELADFYQKAMKDKGWTETVNREVAEARFLQYEKAGRSVTLTLGPGDEGMTLAQVIYEKKSE
jgi:hypothetical protein